MIRKLEWESEFFGISFGEVCGNGVLERISETELQYDIIQYKIDINDIEKIKKAEKAGFNLVDIKMEYSKQIDVLEAQKCSNVRKAKNDDIEEICKLASGSFKQSRFYTKGIPAHKANDFYMIWAEKAVKGTFDNECWVYEEDNIIEGFVTIKYFDDFARIGLIAVGDMYRGKGIGNILVNNATICAASMGKNMIIVDTQLKNILAQNLYIKNGFKISNSLLWYYKVRIDGESDVQKDK